MTELVQLGGDLLIDAEMLLDRRTGTSSWRAPADLLGRNFGNAAGAAAFRASWRLNFRRAALHELHYRDRASALASRTRIIEF